MGRNGFAYKETFDLSESHGESPFSPYALASVNLGSGAGPFVTGANLTLSQTYTLRYRSGNIFSHSSTLTDA